MVERLKATISPPPRLTFDNGKWTLIETIESDDWRPPASSFANEREISRSTDIIIERASSSPTFRVALQFPDEYLGCAPEACTTLEDSIMVSSDLDPLVFVLGDNTLGAECCVDALSAEHLKADLIVHFGHACLLPTRFTDSENWISALTTWGRNWAGRRDSWCFTI